MRGAFVFLAAVLVSASSAGLIGCDKQPAPPPPVPPPPPPPQAAPAAAVPADAGAKPKMVANPDGLSLVERMAKRKAEEKKLADQLAGEEKARLLAYDKTKLPLHQQVFTAIKKVRASYGKAKNAEDVEKIKNAQMKTIEATGKKLPTIDPQGGNSNVTTDYDVMLNLLANEYPEALAASFGGDKAGLEAQTAELDKRSQKVEEWLAEAKSNKPPKPAKK
jgi:hypothetical protein